MEQKIKLRYINERLKVGMVDIKQLYLLSPRPTQLRPEVYKGKLVYRAKGSTRRISFDQIKRGLVKRSFVVMEEVPNWLLKWISGLTSQESYLNGHGWQPHP